GAGGGMGLSPAAMRNQQRAARNQYIKDRVARQQQRAQKKAHDDLFARDASTTDAFGTLLSPDDLPIDKQIERTKFLKRQAAQLKANEARERRLAARDFNQGKLGREGAGDRAEAAVKDKLAAERDAKLAAYDRRKGTADDPFLIDGPDPRRDRERKRAEAEYQRKLQFARRRGERNYQGGDRDEDAKSAIQDQAIGGLVKDAAAKNKITQEEAKAIQALLQQSEDNRAMTEQLRTMMEGLRQQAETGAKDARTRRQKLN
ncbi:MAG: hypothetical protein NT069_22080, partial [Planctomycetota bacterium]|nr:hypothetical protein [Planctomycetota bacterium]